MTLQMLHSMQCQGNQFVKIREKSVGWSSVFILLLQNMISLTFCSFDVFVFTFNCTPPKNVSKWSATSVIVIPKWPKEVTSTLFMWFQCSIYNNPIKMTIGLRINVPFQQIYPHVTLNNTMVGFFLLVHSIHYII